MHTNGRHSGDAQEIDKKTDRQQEMTYITCCRLFRKAPATRASGPRKALPGQASTD
jgi:hypothetical protein